MQTIPRSKREYRQEPFRKASAALPGVCHYSGCYSNVNHEKGEMMNLSEGKTTTTIMGRGEERFPLVKFYVV